MSIDMRKSLSSLERMLSQRYQPMVDFVVSTSKTAYRKHREGYRRRHCWMVRAEICRTNQCVLGKCMCVTPEWSSDTSISPKQRLEWLVGARVSRNGKLNLRKPDSMGSTIVTGPWRQICSRS